MHSEYSQDMVATCVVAWIQDFMNETVFALGLKGWAGVEMWGC